MNPLDQLLREYVTPALAAHGFKKSGRAYRAEGGTGDLVFVAFQPWQTDPGEHVEFFVNLSALPTSYWAWLCAENPKTATRKPQYGDGLWQGRLPAPAEYAAGPEPWNAERWRLPGPGHIDRFGPELARALTEDAVPLLRRLLDRREFLAMVRDPANPLGPNLGPAEIMLLVDEGPSDDLAAEIAQYEAMDPVDVPVGVRLAAWARKRMAPGA